MTSIQQVNNMENYIISNMEFSSKKKIKQKIQEIEKKYMDYQPLVDKDLEFMIDIFKYHSNFESKMKGMTDIYFAPCKEYPSTRCAHIAYGNKNTDIKKRPCDDISWTFCVKRIKVNTLDKFRLPFGSYRGKTIKEVDTLNRSYLVWILGPEFKDLTIKEQVEKYFKMNIEQKINNITITNPNQTIMDFEYQTNKPQKPKVQQNRFRQAVAQYDIHGNLIKTYDSVLDTAKSGYNPQCVSKCINNKLKLHDKNIFIAIKNKNNVAKKIDPTPFITNKNSNLGLNNLIVNSLFSEQKETPTTPEYTKVNIPKNNKTRIGMFLNDGTLERVILNHTELKQLKRAKNMAFKHIYGNFTSKKIKKGYLGKYQFRRLEKGKTYLLGYQYNLAEFKFDYQRRFLNVKRKVKTDILNTVVKETSIPILEAKEAITTSLVENIIPTEQPKRNFMQRLIYLFTGN
jgi:uncharacterized protein (DUF3820 family)